MNLFLTIFFLVVLWLMSMSLAFIGGRFSVREEAKEAQGETSDPAYVVNVNGPDAIVLEELQDRMSALDSQMQALTELQQNAPVDISMGAQRRLEEIEPLLGRVKKLEELVEERDSGYRDRFTRVERRAGMSV